MLNIVSVLNEDRHRTPQTLRLTKTGLKEVYGQLIFSGYDTSRFTENSISFTMADDVTRDLVVALQSISYSGSSSATLLSSSIDIFIDSTDPNIWLPDDVCDAFESAFGLTLDNTTGLYLVNETHRNTLLDDDAEVAFTLSDVSSGGSTVTVTLPYAAFDLTAEYPLVANTSYYFPLKRASNSTQYTLGRTFLQEACVTSENHIQYSAWHSITDCLQLSLSRLRARRVQRISVRVERGRRGEHRHHHIHGRSLDHERKLFYIGEFTIIIIIIGKIKPERRGNSWDRGWLRGRGHPRRRPNRLRHPPQEKKVDEGRLHSGSTRAWTRRVCPQGPSLQLGD